MMFSFLQGFFLFGYLSGGSSFPAPLTPEEEKKYVQAYSRGCMDAKNILIEHNLRLVAYVAKRYTNCAKDSEDLISVGTIGLIKAVASYNPEKKAKLATYAIRCIQNEILMLIRANKKSANDIYLQDIVGTDREGNEIKIEDKIADDNYPIDEQVGLKIQLKNMFNAVINTLRGRERLVIILRYGLVGEYEEMTQREIAEKLNISRSYVSRIEKKALGKLREKIEEQ